MSRKPLSAALVAGIIVAAAGAAEARDQIRMVGSSTVYPFATARIEELIDELRANYTIVIVTHSMQQAARVSQRTAFFHLGDVVEVSTTKQIFTKPVEDRTQDYITGRFG